MTVSIILTSYNYGKYLKDTITSVVAQTYRDWELVIIDDCSDDNSFDIIMEFANSDSRIRVIKNHINQGLAKSLQTALLAVAGEWVVFLESDDLLKGDYLEKKLKVAEEYPSVGLIYNNVEFFGDDSLVAEKKFSSLITKNQKINFPTNMFYKLGYENLILTMSSVMVKRRYLDELDFETPIDKLLDWYLYIQLARKTDFYYLDEKLTLWRQHSDSYLNKDRKIKFRFANIEAYLLVLKREPWNLKLVLYIIFSTFLMCMKRLSVYLSK